MIRGVVAMWSQALCQNRISPETFGLSRGVVAMGSESEQLRQFMGREMLRGAFAAVASAGPSQRADLLHLALDILTLQLPLAQTAREVS